MDRRHFDYLCGPQGPLLVGSPPEIIAKHQLFNNTRFLAQLVIRGIPRQSVLRSIELLGTQVASAVRTAIGSPSSQTTIFLIALIIINISIYLPYFEFIKLGPSLSKAALARLLVAGRASHTAGFLRYHVSNPPENAV